MKFISFSCFFLTLFSKIKFTLRPYAVFCPYSCSFHSSFFILSPPSFSLPFHFLSPPYPSSLPYHYKLGKKYPSAFSPTLSAQSKLHYDLLRSSPLILVPSLSLPSSSFIPINFQYHHKICLPSAFSQLSFSQSFIMTFSAVQGELTTKYHPVYLPLSQKKKQLKLYFKILVPASKGYL